MNRIVPFAITCFLAMAGLGAQTFKVVGYLPYYRFPLADEISFEKLTHLCLAFANPDMQGKLIMPGQNFTPIVEAAHLAGVDVLVSIGGGLTASTRAAWQELAKPQNRSVFIQKIVGFVNSYDLQGVDMDLEWGDVDENYPGFVLELGDSLRARGKLITAALPGTHRYPQVSDEALHSFDFINMMAYDLTGPWAPNNPGPHSPFSFAKNSINYWEAQGMAGDKLTLGLPFYGYDFTNPANVVSFTFGSMVDENPAYAQLDQVGKKYYNGIPTIQAKTELAIQRASGVCIWELGQDAFNEYSLLQAIHSVLVVGAEEPLAAEDPIRVFPNPFGSILRGDGIAGQKVLLRLTNTNGQVLMEQQLENEDNFSFDTAGLLPGLYFLAKMDGQAVVTVKVVKS